MEKSLKNTELKLSPISNRFFQFFLCHIYDFNYDLKHLYHARYNLVKKYLTQLKNPFKQFAQILSNTYKFFCFACIWYLKLFMYRNVQHLVIKTYLSKLQIIKLRFIFCNYRNKQFFRYSTVSKILCVCL